MIKYLTEKKWNNGVKINGGHHLNHNQHGWKNEVIYFIAATTIWNMSYHIIYILWNMNQYMNIRIDMRPSTPKDEGSMTKQYQYPSIVSVSRCFTLVPDYCMTTSSILPIGRHNHIGIKPAADESTYYSIKTYIWRVIIKNEIKRRLSYYRKSH